MPGVANRWVGYGGLIGEAAPKAGVGDAQSIASPPDFTAQRWSMGRELRRVPARPRGGSSDWNRYAPSVTPRRGKCCVTTIWEDRGRGATAANTLRVGPTTLRRVGGGSAGTSTPALIRVGSRLRCRMGQSQDRAIRRKRGACDHVDRHRRRDPDNRVLVALVDQDDAHPRSGRLPLALPCNARNRHRRVVHLRRPPTRRTHLPG